MCIHICHRSIRCSCMSMRQMFRNVFGRTPRHGTLRAKILRAHIVWFGGCHRNVMNIMRCKCNFHNRQTKKKGSLLFFALAVCLFIFELQNAQQREALYTSRLRSLHAILVFCTTRHNTHITLQNSECRHFFPIHEFCMYAMRQTSAPHTDKARVHPPKWFLLY